MYNSEHAVKLAGKLETDFPPVSNFCLHKCENDLAKAPETAF
jgi:hypothetical protein